MLNFSSNLAILFPLGSCLYIAMRLSDGQVDGKRGGWARALVYTVTSLLIAFSFTGIFFRAGLLSIAWIIAFIFLLLLAWGKSRAINRALMLYSFAAVNSNIARERMASDFMERNSWFVASRSKRLRRALETGLDWPKAMQEVGIANTMAEIFSCNCLAKFGPNFEREVAPALDPLRIRSETERLLGRLIVFPWSVKGLLIIPVILTFVLPTMKSMFQEFGLDLPASMQSFIALSDQVTELGMGSLIILSVLLLVGLGGLVGVIWLFPRLALVFPIRWFIKPYLRALAATSLALSVRREPDFSMACTAAAELLPIGLIADQLKTAGQFHSQGMSPDRALARANLLGPRDARVLQASVHTNSFPWALEQIAVSSVERMFRLYSIAIQLLIVILVLFLALIFGWLAVAFIEVLTTMIIKLT